MTSALVTMCLLTTQGIENVREVRLPNGLRLLLLEDHAAPVFTIFLWVPAGSRTEVPGKTGLSHYLEHLYSMGSSKMGPREIDQFITRHGGEKNAFTSLDITAYFESMPISTLDEVLEVEADRFETLSLPADFIDSEREVVIEERRMRYETSQFGPLWHGILDLAYTTHAYRKPVIGYVPDIRSITRDVLVEYYRAHYTTENVVYVLVGDFDAAQATEKFRRYFGSIPRRPAPRLQIPPEPPQTAERRRTITRADITLPAFMIGWHTVGIDHADFFPLKVLEYYLSTGRASVLPRVLVRERELATDVGAEQVELRDPSLFVVQAQARPGVDIERLERAVYEILDQVVRDGPDPERLQASKNAFEVGFLGELESTQDRARALGEYQVTSQEGWRFLSRYVERARAVTADQVRDVARRYLRPENRSVFTQLPGEPAVEIAWEPHGSAHRTQLPNGLTLIVDETGGTAAAAVHLLLRAGSRYDPPGRSGLATLTQRMLLAGTARHDEEALSEAFAQLGTDMGDQMLHDTVSLTTYGRTEDVGRLLGLVAEVVAEPAFAPESFEQIKGRLLAERESAASNPGDLLVENFYLALYGEDHPYGPPIQGRVADLQAATREDVIEFHRQRYRPERGTLVIVGAVNKDEVGAAAARTFGAWEGEGDAPSEAESAAQPSRERIVIFHRPGQVQAYVRLGHAGIRRQDADYDVLSVGNQLLGGSGLASRLSDTVRTHAGLAYSVWSNQFARELEGAFAIQIEVRNEKIREAFDLIFQEVNRARTEPAPEDELGDMISKFAGELPFRREKRPDRARLLAEGVLYGLSPTYMEDQVRAVQVATPVAVRNALQTHVRPDEMRIVIVGDAEAIRGALEGLGEIRVVNAP